MNMKLYINLRILILNLFMNFTTEDPRPLVFSPTLRQVDERDSKVEAATASHKMPKKWGDFLDKQ